MENQKLRELYEAGQTLQEIANYCEVSKMCIYLRLKKTGVTFRKTGSRRTAEETEILRDEIARLRTQGLTLREISTTVGLCHTSVERHLKHRTTYKPSQY